MYLHRNAFLVFLIDAGKGSTRVLKTMLRRLGFRTAPTAGDHKLSNPGLVPDIITGLPCTRAVCEIPVATDYQGYLDELTDWHIQGWVQDRAAPNRRVECEAVLQQTGEIVARVCADQFGHGLSAGGVGDGAHVFWTRFTRSLNQSEGAQLVVRVAGSDVLLPAAPNLKTRYEPLLHVAMDIVDNCNLRCPFCLYDYTDTNVTHFMSYETLDAALRFLPFTRDGEFWFSCLHEPTLHPELRSFIERVPDGLRQKLFFTSNLAKRMPSSYFDWLANSRIHHINISIESRDPAIYERMRKGARFRIFQENWDALIAALDQAPQPIRLRYIAMAYKSNLRELPELTRVLLQERRAWQVEIRYTFDVQSIPQEFRAAEFLDETDWVWLAEELGAFPPDRVVLVRPPAPARAESKREPSAAADAPILPGRYMFRLSWDGSLRVVGTLTSSRYDSPKERDIDRINIRDIKDPRKYFENLMNIAG